MHRVPKIFVRSPNNRGDEADSGSGVGFSPRLAAKRKPRLDRRNAMKNINYDFSPPAVISPSPSSYCSEESLRRQSLDYYGGKTSFRIDGMDGEVEILCRSLGFSGVEDFGIPAEEYEAMKVRSSSAPVAFSQAFELIDRKMQVDCELVANLSASSDDVDVVHKNGERNDANVGLSVVSNDMAHKKKEERLDLFDLDRNKTDVVGSQFGASYNVNGRSNELRGTGIKGVRPPVLTPPPSMPFQIVENECSWDNFKMGSCLGDKADGSEDSGHRVHDNEDQEEDGSKRIVEREETCAHSRCCSFTSTSNDDDSSSSTTEPALSFSPNGRCRRAILEWQKGELLGRGSFGSVYEGIADDGFFFAVKEVSLLDHGEEGKQRILQLEQEITLLSQFEHENIVQYYGTKRDESRLYIFLELVSKGSLLSLYQKYTLRDSQVCAYTRQILHGLKYLHDRNVVHRDIKCANILVHADGSVKLADFGLAKATKLNDVKSCKGTAFWMAPEVVRSRGYGLAADIWSLGCTVLEMLTGRFPYSNMECMAALYRIGKGERPLIPDTLSSDARNLILQCLQVDPKLRPTAAQLLDHPFLKRPPPSPLHFHQRA